MVKGEYRVVSFGGRKLSITEAGCSLIEKLLVAALWGLMRYERYTAFAPNTVILLPHAAEVGLIKKVDSPLRVQSAMIALSSFKCTFACGEGAWALQGKLAGILEDPPGGEDPGEVPVWEHVDITLEYPQVP